MTRSGRAGAVLLALLFAVPMAACEGGSKGEAITARPPDPALRGRFFAAAGQSDSVSDLYDVQFTPLRLYQLTTTGRTFGLSGCPSTLVVTVAGKEEGFRDTLRRFDASGATAIDGLADASGALPALSPDCRMVFTRFDRSTNPPTSHLVRYDPATGATTDLYADTPGRSHIGIPDWGPGGRVAVVEGTADSTGSAATATGIVIISPDGSKRTIPAPVSQFGTIQWGASKWIAVADEGKGIVFLDPDSGTRTDLPGWVPLAWSPDGQRLIVADAAHRKTLGVVDTTADLRSVRTVGSVSKAAVFDLVWLPPDATAGVPLTVARRPDDGES